MLYFGLGSGRLSLLPASTLRSYVNSSVSAADGWPASVLAPWSCAPTIGSSPVWLPSTVITTRLTDCSPTWAMTGWRRSAKSAGVGGAALHGGDDPRQARVAASIPRHVSALMSSP